MKNTLVYKPFNLEHAKAGAPLGVLGSGGGLGQSLSPVRLIDIKYRGDNLVVIATSSLPITTEHLFVFGDDGKHAILAHTLVMLPLDYIEDTPIFVGDPFECKYRGGVWLSVSSATAIWNKLDQVSYRLPPEDEEKKPSPKWEAVILDTRDPDQTPHVLQGVFDTKEGCESNWARVSKYMLPFVFVRAQEKKGD